MAIPNINTKPHHQNKGDPVMSMKCDNSVQVIELLEGINLLREEIEKKIKGKFIFSTAQYEYGRGSVIYSSNNDFHSSYSVFKDCVDFYYYDDSTTNQSSDLDFHSELIPFPTKDN
jgi:hypothetical protein